MFGGAGQDKLVGGTGSDNFAFDNFTDYASNAYNRVDDFDNGEGDAITISSLLSGYDPLNHLLSDFVDVVDNGSHTYIRVDEAGASNFNSIVQLTGYTGHGDDASDMVVNGSLVIV